jgi:hypothetical protein
MSAWFWIGLGVVALLILIPAVLVVRVVVGIAAAYLEHRRDVRNRTSCALPGLGDFESSDGVYWFGEVEELSVTIETSHGPPTMEVADAVRRCIERLPELVAAARDWLVREESVESDPDRLELTGLHWRSQDDFDIDLYDTAEEYDGQVISVQFEHGRPSSASVTH